MKRELQCHCGEKIETDFPEEIDISSRPEAMEEIISGSFMSVRCPACNALLKPEFFTHIFDSSGRLDLSLLPELDRSRYLAGKLEVHSKHVAIGFPELREKILLFKEGYDDRAVEILKFLLLQKIDDPDSADIRLMEISDDGELIFHISGLKKEEVAVSRLPGRLYERVFSDLEERIEEEPFSEISAGQYVSINKISIEDEES